MLFYVLSFFFSKGTNHRKSLASGSQTNPDSSPCSVTLYFRPWANHITFTFLSLSFLLSKMVIMSGVPTSQVCGKALGIASSEPVSWCYRAACGLRSTLLQPPDSQSTYDVVPSPCAIMVRKGEISISELAPP